MTDSELDTHELLEKVESLTAENARLRAAFEEISGERSESGEDSGGFCLPCQNAPLGCLTLDRGGRIIHVNSEWSNLLGYQPDEAIGSLFVEYLTTEGKLRFRECLDRLQRTGSVRNADVSAIRRDGARIVVGLDGNLVRADESNGLHALIVLRDVTESRRTQRAIQRAKKEWEHTFDAVPDLVAILDENFRIVRLNKAMADRLGLDVREAVGGVCHEIVHSSVSPPDYCPHRRVWRDGLEHEVEVHEPRLGGTFLVTASPIRDEDGTLIGSAHVARDISDRKRAEEALKKARDELEERVRERTAELHIANELLKDKIRTIDELYEHLIQARNAKAIAEHTATVAHELRQPLAIIGGFTRRLSADGPGDRPLDADQRRQFYGIIITEVERLERILRRLIDFGSRDELGLDKVRPHEIIEGVLAEYKQRLREQNVTVHTRLDEEIGEICLDREKFQEVLRSLISNALDIAPSGERITVETALSQPTDRLRHAAGLDTNRYFQMKIQTHGRAAPEEEVKAAFNPFHGPEKSEAGLGLTLARKIVEDHNGSISVQSDGNDTLLTVWLPADGDAEPPA